jgi:hypothetical protein
MRPSSTSMYPAALRAPGHQGEGAGRNLPPGPQPRQRCYRVHRQAHLEALPHIFDWRTKPCRRRGSARCPPIRMAVDPSRLWRQLVDRDRGTVDESSITVVEEKAMNALRTIGQEEVPE